MYIYLLLAVVVSVPVVLVVALPSIRIIGPTEVGLVTKRFSLKKLMDDNPIAFNGEAGYQAELLMPGWRFKCWLMYKVEKHPWVQISAGKIGVVVSQIGKALPVGAKSGIYKEEFGNFVDVKTYVANGGEKGVQRPVLPPGTLAPIHPVAFLVIAEDHVYGIPVAEDLVQVARRSKTGLTPGSFGLSPEQLRVQRIEPVYQDEKGAALDMVGIVTTYEGDPFVAGKYCQPTRWL